jgi:Tol biopolymer transport system component
MSRAPIVDPDRCPIGAEQPVRAEPALFSNAVANNGRLSPDGKRLAIYMAGATGQIKVLDLERGTSTFLTDEWDNGSPDWTPDEAHIAFFSTRGGGGGAANLYWQRSDGSTPAERLTTSDHRQAPYSWSHYNKVLAYTDNDPNTRSDIWTLSIDDRKAKQFVGTSAEETGPAFSPDGHWIAYQSNKARPDRPEVYVQAFPSGGMAQQVSNAGGTQPMWRGDHEIVYRRGQSVMSVQIATAPTFHPSEPVERFRTPNTLIDLMPDGRLLMVTATLAPPVTELEIVVNWFQELRKKMAGGR